MTIKKLPDVRKKIEIPADQHEPAEITIRQNLKRLTEKHNDEKLAITLWDWFNCLSFLVENKWHQYYLQSVVLW